MNTANSLLTEMRVIWQIASGRDEDSQVAEAAKRAILEVLEMIENKPALVLDWEPEVAE